MPVADYIRKGRVQPPHSVRVRTVNESLNAAVANANFLRFDTIDNDTDGYAVGNPVSGLKIPSGLGGLYIVAAEASSTGNQSITVGTGILINNNLATLKLSPANQYINGPGSVNYCLTSNPTQIGYLNDGDLLQLYNTSVSPGPNAFTNVFLALVRISDIWLP